MAWLHQMMQFCTIVNNDDEAHIASPTTINVVCLVFYLADERRVVLCASTKSGGDDYVNAMFFDVSSFLFI